MPNIKLCLLRSKYYIIEDYVSIFDYTSMINILELDIGLNEFLDLDCSLYKNLYYLKINFNYYDINHNHYLKKKAHSIGIKMLKKILSIKTLRVLDIPYIDINEKDKVDGQLESVTHLYITIDSFIKDKNRYLLINKIQKKFPNLVYFYVLIKTNNIKIRNDLTDKIKHYEWYVDKMEERNITHIKFHD